ncbi:hypothetical protein LWI29_027551 [Acer saccharum]|uniref:Uncharacterized protein n=1 Tax=Acer saccharum TaxID=4024 RepID=A0AA39RSL8_ACESA|nr:hypothetical protein LWI29_027551 [Acer saccharum]
MAFSSKLPASSMDVSMPPMLVSSGSLSVSLYPLGSQKENSAASSQSTKGKKRNRGLIRPDSSHASSSTPPSVGVGNASISQPTVPTPPPEIMGSTPHSPAPFPVKTTTRPSLGEMLARAAKTKFSPLPTLNTLKRTSHMAIVPSVIKVALPPSSFTVSTQLPTKTEKMQVDGARAISFTDSPSELGSRHYDQ